MTESLYYGRYWILYKNFQKNMRIMNLKITWNEISSNRRCLWGKGEVCTGFWWGNLRERDRWGDPGVDGRIILGWIFKKCDVGVRTGLGWLRIGTSGGHL
jgi:hypothetical protein